MEFIDYYSGESLSCGEIKEYEPLYKETEADLVAMFKREQLKVARERALSGAERLALIKEKAKARAKTSREKKRNELKAAGLLRERGRAIKDLSTLSADERRKVKANRRYLKKWRDKKRKELKEQGLYFGKGRHTKEQNAYLGLLAESKADELAASLAESTAAILAQNAAAEQKFLNAAAAQAATSAAAEKIRANLA